MSHEPNKPHQGQPLLSFGAAPSEARVGMVMVHGRGATAESILTLAGELNVAGVRFLAPQAAGNTWYPYSFLAPTERNEPGLSSGLQAISDAIKQLERDGVSSERMVLLGFSQGACLALEYAFRRPRRYGGVTGLSGGHIAPSSPELQFERSAGESLAGTPVFLGCSDIDPHISIQRVEQTADALRELDGNVTFRLYAGMGHTINNDEIDFVEDLLRSLTTS